MPSDDEAVAFTLGDHLKM